MGVVSAPSNIERPGAGHGGGGPDGPAPDADAAGSPDPTTPSPAPPAPATVRPADVPERQAPADVAERPARDGAGGRWRRIVTTALSMVILVAGLVLLVPRPNAVPLQLVDVSTAARRAAPVLGFAPSVPSGLQGWTATTAVVRDGTDGIATWHVGFITPQGNYAGIEQATRSDFTWENALDSGGLWVGSVEVDGRTWAHMEKAERNTTALILRRPGRVTLVTAKGGGVPDAVTLIRSLPPDTLS
jgi:Protein of unknown function (DUF4245)